MPSYKKPYLKLIRAQNKAIKQLVKAAQEAEELLIAEEKPALLLRAGGQKNNPQAKAGKHSKKP